MQTEAPERPTLDTVYDAADEECREGQELDAQLEKEMELLDGLPWPGKPADDAERHKAWMSLPRKARAAVRRLHHMLGHKPREVILHVLTGARAPQEYIDAAKHFQCSACHEVKRSLIHI